MGSARWYGGRRLLAGIVGAALLLGGGAVLGVAPPAAADDGGEFTLRSGDTKNIVTNRPYMNNGLVLNHLPEQCRSQVPFQQTCDTYRMHLELDESEGAVNFVRFELNFDTIRLPALSVVAAGTVPITLTDANLYVYDISGEDPVLVDVPGSAAPYAVPEIAGFEPTLRMYDVVVASARGPLLGYSLNITFSNELFDSPFEILDPATRDNPFFNAPEDRSSDETPFSPRGPSEFAGDLTPFSDPISGLAPLIGSPGLSPLAPDADFAGFRGAIDGALEGDLGSANSLAASAPPTITAAAPSAALAIFWLLLVPGAVTGAIWAWLRRRRPPALAG